MVYVQDITIFSNLNLHKLFTKEDPFYFHKIFGVISLINYIYRYWLLFIYGSMFINTSVDLALVSVHGLLSMSSLIFIFRKNVI